jgi:zinc protease
MKRQQPRDLGEKLVGGLGRSGAGHGLPGARGARPFRFLLILALLGFLSPSRAPARQPAPKQEVLRAKLENGLRVVIVRNSLAPVAATVVNYLVGSSEAPPGFPGTAHAQEHMMFRGSPGLTADQLANIADAMGGRFDADTQQTVTQYFFTVPSEDLDIALRIEAIRMSGVLDSEQLWEKERGAIEQEVAQDLSNPEYVFYTQLLSAMFKGTPYAHDALGTKSSFEKTTGAMLQAFHEAWYAPNNAILVVVGDVEPRETLDSVRRMFGAIPSRKIPGHPSVRLEPVKPEKLSLTTDLPYGLALICFRLPGYRSPEYAAARILSDVLGSERGRLYELVVQGKALAAGFALNPLPEAGLGFAYAAFPAGGDADALIKQIKDIVSEAAEKGVQPDLVAAAQRKTEADDQFRKNSISGLAMAWSQAVAIEGLESPEEATEAVRKVTPAAVDRAAARYLTLDHAVSAVLTPQPSGKPVSSKGFGGLESFAPAKVKPVALPEWAERALKRLEIPSSSVRPQVTTLPNGLTLIVQQESISDSITVVGRIKSNLLLQAPNGKEGVDRILGQLFDYGTSSLDRLAFQKALDDIGAAESAGREFSLGVLPQHFDRGIELLADNELRPALPESAFEVTRAQTAAAIAGELKSPDYLAERALLEALLPAGDPGLRQATPPDVAALTLADVKEYYQRVFRPDMTVVTVIGKIEPAAARLAIERNFGGWKGEGPKPQVDWPPLPPNKPSVTDVPDASRIQDSVVLAQTLGLTRSAPDFYPLQVGNHVLGGGFYATRLYRDLREERGLVYYVSSTFEIGKTRSFYRASYGCDPANAAEARTILVRDFKDMQTSQVTPEELSQAKAVLLREIPLAESSVESIAAGLLTRSIEDLPLDEPVLAARKYLNISAEQVRAAFVRWLRPDDLAEVKQGPSSRGREPEKP